MRSGERVMKRLNTLYWVKLVLVLGLSIFVLGYSVWITSSARSGSRERKSERLNATEESMEWAQGFEVVLFQAVKSAHEGDLGDDQAIDSIESVLERAKVYNQAGLEDSAIESIVRVASEFIYYRFILDDPERYIRWRLQRGDRFRDMEAMYVKAQVALDYEELFGESLTDQTPLSQSFTRLYEHQRSLWTSRYTPIGYAVDPESVLVVSATHHPIVGKQDIDLGDPQLNRLWLETLTGGHRSWFRGQTDHDQLEANLEKYQVATVGIVIEYENMERRTLYLGILRSSTGGDWSVEALSATDTAFTGGLIEF